MATPHHNTRMNATEVSVSGSVDATITLITRYTCTYLCEPSGIISTRRNTQDDGTGNLNDNYIDPSTRNVDFQSFIDLKEGSLSYSENKKSLSLKLDNFGANPGKKFKIVVLVFEIHTQNQIYQVYLTIKILKNLGKDKRGYTTHDSCFFSNLIENEQDEFIQSIISAQSDTHTGSTTTTSSHKSSKRKRTPNRVARNPSVIADKRLNNFLNEGNSNLSSTPPPPNEDDNSQNLINQFGPISFNDVKMSKIHFDGGPKYGGQANTIYLSLKDRTPLPNEFEALLRNCVQSLNIRFIPIDDQSIEIGIPQVLHATPVGNEMSITLITPAVEKANVPTGDIRTWVFITVNEELLEGDIEYTFFDPNMMMSSSQIQPLNYVDPTGQSVITIASIGQFARQQYHQSAPYFDDLEHFLQNFEAQFGSIVDIFGFNFAGFLKYNKFDVQGIEFKEIVCPEGSIDESEPIQEIPANIAVDSTTTTTINRKEELLCNAEEATNKIVEFIKTRIDNMLDEKMIENGVQTLLHKMTSSLDDKECWNYLVNNMVPQKHLDAFYNPGKRHARNDKVPYHNVKVVIYDEAALPSQENQNIPPKLKVALFFAKFVISFDENKHMITIEDQERKENFLYQTFYDCNIYTVRKSDEIDQFLLNLAKFNCQWNCTQFYDEKNSNTGHYVIAALKHLGIWNPEQLWAQFTTNVCEGKPLEKHVTVYPDFFHMDSKNNIPTTLNTANGVACPRLKTSLLEYMKSETDAPFKYSFKGYSETDQKHESSMARQELELFCELLRTCGESYLKNMEDGVRVQRLLKKIMQTNYGQSLTPETWQHLKQVSDKHNQTFHKQMYNFPNFFNLIKPTSESEQLEKKMKPIYDKVWPQAMQM